MLIINETKPKLSQINGNEKTLTIALATSFTSQKIKPTNNTTSGEKASIDGFTCNTSGKYLATK